ncbi:MAG: MATE family efflux transporter [Myxococcota bacterium]
MSAAIHMQDSSESDAEIAPFLRVPEPLPLRGFGHLRLRWDLSTQLLRVAMPVVLGMVTQTAINILDTVMVGRLPPAEANPGQAAIGYSLNFMWLVGGFLSAIWVGTQALTSRRAGEGNSKAAGRVLTNSLLLSLSSSTAFAAIAIVLTPILFPLYANDPVVAAYGTEYLQIRYIGIIGMVGTFSYKSFFDGIGKTHVFMIAAGIMNLANVVLNYVLIFGAPWASIPRMGVVGAAWASAISATLGLITLALWSLLPSFLRRYRYYDLKNISMQLMRELLRLSLPNGAATIFVMAGFVLLYKVVSIVNALHAPSGNPVLATANQVVITCLMPSFMTSLAFGSATAAVVSQALGAKRPDLAERYGWEAIKLWSYVMSVLGLLLFLFPDAVISLANQDPAVIDAARLPLRMLAVPHALIAVAAILAQTLHGIGNARFVMMVEGILHFGVMSPLAYLFGVQLDWGLEGVLMGPLAYVLALAIIMFWKFRQGTWKEIVI